MKNKVLGKIALALALLGPVSLAHANLITFDLSYAGVDNAATGIGSITFDDTVLPNPGFELNVTAATLGITAFSITIAGASAGNGTFDLADVTNWVWDTTSALDLTTELVGQAGFNDFNWCALDFDGCAGPAPGGVGIFTIMTNAELDGDVLLLTSMRPSDGTTTVPEPTTLALLAAGLAALALRRRRAA